MTIAASVIESYESEIERIDYVISLKTEDIENLAAKRRKLEALIQRYRERLSDDN